MKSFLRITDLIYTDCWPKNQEKEQVRELFSPYQITSAILSKLHDKAFFLPCPPVTRGEEVSEEAMKSEHCMNYEAKEFLLHSQNAIMEHLAREYNK
jgi:ornithine carbamoyltransferase